MIELCGKWYVTMHESNWKEKLSHQISQIVEITSLNIYLRVKLNYFSTFIFF